MPSTINLDIRARYPIADGEPFGDAGSYERIDARATVRIDPEVPQPTPITDLRHAPVGSDGLVAFTIDVQILRPVDASRGNQRLFLEMVNRGNKRCLQFFNDAPGTNDPRLSADFGNGFLMRRGYTVAWIAWQGDILPGNHRILIDLPTVTKGDRPITGSVRAEFIATKSGQTTFPLSGWVSTRSHPAVSLDTLEATLVRRRYPADTPQPIASDAWMFARTEGGGGLDNQGAEQSIVPSPTHIHMPQGFATGWIYELIYEARDPLVMGLGHVAVRDVASFLKHDVEDADGTPNPLRQNGARIEKVYGWGRSQTGRYLRDFVHQGFNADTENRPVFDGIIPHVSGGGMMWLNHRFANGVSPAGQEYEYHLNPADRFPFTYGSSVDHLTGRTDAILKRPATDPLVLHTQTATEYWQRRGSLIHTDTAGRDVDLPDTVRAYLWSSSQHFADPILKSPGRGVCREILNVVWTSMLFRAMLDAMDAWATDGVEPPPSRVPKTSDGTLVDIDAWRETFPDIPGIMTPLGPAALHNIDWGPGMGEGIVTEPPTVRSGPGYTVLVPRTDADGNDIAGVRAPMVEAPLATYTGWNLRARAHGHGAMNEFTGSTIPFPQSEAERAQTRDPRPSIETRYGDRAGYVAAIRKAAETLVADRLMLEEDVERCAAAAANWSAPRHDVELA